MGKVLRRPPKKDFRSRRHGERWIHKGMIVVFIKTFRLTSGQAGPRVPKDHVKKQILIKISLRLGCINPKTEACKVNHRNRRIGNGPRYGDSSCDNTKIV